ncbi:hypothetical protein [uncultured Draconibacterium sp.]|uniref:hypothetical protein n=1 Tax=uncultured Draconibacterium sp. TaxID=1573823 RepID=UPI003216EC44
MSNQTKHIESNIVELKSINSNAFYILKITGVIIASIGVLLGALVFTRGASPNALSRFIELPLSIELFLGFLVFILIILGVSIQFNKYKNKGKIELRDNTIKINEETFSIKNKTIQFYFNSLKNKSTYKRDFMEGCNNWIEFENNGKTIKKEFKIESKIHDDNILNQIAKWQHSDIDVKIKEKKRNFWQMWNDF